MKLPSKIALPPELREGCVACGGVHFVLQPLYVLDAEVHALVWTDVFAKCQSCGVATAVRIGRSGAHE